MDKIDCTDVDLKSAVDVGILTFYDLVVFDCFPLICYKFEEYVTISSFAINFIGNAI